MQATKETAKKTGQEITGQELMPPRDESTFLQATYQNLTPETPNRFPEIHHQMK
jgi:hypothetical protein